MHQQMGEYITYYASLTILADSASQNTHRVLDALFVYLSELIKKRKKKKEKNHRTETNPIVKRTSS